MSHSAFDIEHDWFKQLFEMSPDPTWVIEGNRFVECNNAALLILGYSNRKEFLNLYPSKLSPPRQPDGEDSFTKAERMMAIAMDKGVHQFEWIHTKADGNDFPAEVTLSAIKLQDRQFIYCVWRDITERKRIEKALQESEERFRHAMDASTDGLWDWNFTNDKRYFSPACYKMLGYEFNEFPMTGKAWAELIHPDDYQHIRSICQDCVINHRQSFEAEHRLKCKDGSWKWIMVRGKALERDSRGYATRMIGTHVDVSERKLNEERVRELAYFDALTKLPNRRLLNDRLSQAMATSKRSSCYGAAMFVDLDNFKPLNDKYGHEVGDSLLIEAADRLKSCVRETDTVARLGGDEFVAILSVLNADRSESYAQAAIIAERVRVALAEPYVLRIRKGVVAETTVEYQCTASIGLALFGKHDASEVDVLKWADTAMYQAKEAGRNSIRFFDQKD